MPGKRSFPDSWNEEKKEGKWIYDKKLGEGGFGVVCMARGIHFNEPVAIKILKTMKVRDCIMATREVRYAKRLVKAVYHRTGHRIFPRYLEDHTGLAEYEEEAIIKWAVEENWKDVDVNALISPAPYIVMELVKGETVKSLMMTNKLAFHESVEILRQAAAALQYLRKVLCIHRDFRVHNLMWYKGQLRVIDFGLALYDCGPELETSTNPVIRTYWKQDSYWMPPEVKTTTNVINFFAPEPYSFDIYSYGVLVLELLIEVKTANRMTKSHKYIEDMQLQRLEPYRARQWSNLSEATLDSVGLDTKLFYRCISMDPKDRPIADEIIRVLHKNSKHIRIYGASTPATGGAPRPELRSKSRQQASSGNQSLPTEKQAPKDGQATDQPKKQQPQQQQDAAISEQSGKKPTEQSSEQSGEKRSEDKDKHGSSVSRRKRFASIFDDPPPEDKASVPMPLPHKAAVWEAARSVKRQRMMGGRQRETIVKEELETTSVSSSHQKKDAKVVMKRLDQDLETLAGKDRTATKSVMNYVARIAGLLMEYPNMVDAMVKRIVEFMHKKDISPLRVICVIDCTLRKNAKDAHLCRSAFAPEMKNIIQLANQRYNGKSHSDASARGKIAAYVNLWGSQKIFSKDIMRGLQENGLQEEVPRSVGPASQRRHSSKSDPPEAAAPEAEAAEQEQEEQPQDDVPALEVDGEEERDRFDDVNENHQEKSVKPTATQQQQRPPIHHGHSIRAPDDKIPARTSESRSRTRESSSRCASSVQDMVGGKKGPLKDEPYMGSVMKRSRSRGKKADADAVHLLGGPPQRGESMIQPSTVQIGKASSVAHFAMSKAISHKASSKAKSESTATNTKPKLVEQKTPFSGRNICAPVEGAPIPDSKKQHKEDEKFSSLIPPNGVRINHPSPNGTGTYHDILRPIPGRRSASVGNTTANKSMIDEPHSRARDSAPCGHNAVCQVRTQDIGVVVDGAECSNTSVAAALFPKKCSPPHNMGQVMRGLKRLIPPSMSSAKSSSPMARAKCTMIERAPPAGGQTAASCLPPPQSNVSARALKFVSLKCPVKKNLGVSGERMSSDGGPPPSVEPALINHPLTSRTGRENYLMKKLPTFGLPSSEDPPTTLGGGPCKKNHEIGLIRNSTGTNLEPMHQMKRLPHHQVGPLTEGTDPATVVAPATTKGSLANSSMIRMKRLPHLLGTSSGDSQGHHTQEASSSKSVKVPPTSPVVVAEGGVEGELHQINKCPSQNNSQGSSQSRLGSMILIKDVIKHEPRFPPHVPPTSVMNDDSQGSHTQMASMKLKDVTMEPHFPPHLPVNGLDDIGQASHTQKDASITPQDVTEDDRWEAEMSLSLTDPSEEDNSIE